MQWNRIEFTLKGDFADHAINRKKVFLQIVELHISDQNKWLCGKLTWLGQTDPRD